MGTVVLAEVERLLRGERRRSPRALWLWWHGEGKPDLDLLWKAYCRRFDVEHFVILRGFVALLPLLGTPASAPKPCGRSPGKPRGSRPGPAKRYPAVKKGA